MTVARSVSSLAVSGDRPSEVSGRLIPFSGFSFVPPALVLLHENDGLAGLCALDHGFQLAVVVTHAIADRETSDHLRQRNAGGKLHPIADARLSRGDEAYPVAGRKPRLLFR